MTSYRTKQCRAFKWIFTIIHIALLLGPFSLFIPYAYSSGNNAENAALTGSILVSLILLVFSIITDVKHRAGLHKTVIWLLVGGIMTCLTEDFIVGFVWTMVAVSVVDELIVIPVKTHYAVALTANIEIDKRNML